MAQHDPQEGAARKAALLQSLASPIGEEPAPTDTLHGFTMQALSGADLVRAKAFARNRALSGKPEQRQEAFELGQMAGYLAYGVTEPRMSGEEWLHHLERPGTAAKVTALVARIKELSGIEDDEVVIAKKVLEQMQFGTGS